MGKEQILNRKTERAALEEGVHFSIGTVPAVLYGAPAAKVWLFVHGQYGCKEEAAAFADIVCPRGAQVLAVDRSGHGVRKAEPAPLTPWEAEPGLRAAATYAARHWETVSVRANSIGAYFALLFLDEPARALLVSPVLDMERLILDRMKAQGVSEEQLQARGEIPSEWGDALSWRYLCYVREHPILRWRCPISLLYAGRDTVVSRGTVDAFVRSHAASLTVMEEGEHWFHTPDQLSFLRRWEQENC